MSYQVYFASLNEENEAYLLALLRLKDEAGTLEPAETELLLRMRGPAPTSGYAPDEPDYEQPSFAQRRGKAQPRRPRGVRNANGRGYFGVN